MEIKEVASRGILFTFYDIGMATNVYSIVGRDYFFIVDSYLGPKTMEKVDKYLKNRFGDKKYIVINTHSDWDHIWGNIFFEGSKIIGHRDIAKNILVDGEKYLEKYSKYKRGEVKLLLPNILFDGELEFLDEDIYIFTSKGHTDDSISVVDRRDRVLLAGDNIEGPIPYLQSRDLSLYIDSLERYLDEDIDIVIGGHTQVLDKGIIYDNLAYVKDFAKGVENPKYKENQVHMENLDFFKKIRGGYL